MKFGKSGTAKDSQSCRVPFMRTALFSFRPGLENHNSGVKVDGSGDVTDTHVQWSITSGIPAKPSPIVRDGLIYVIEDNGVASCFETSTGDTVWKKRIGGKFSASPLMVGDRIYLGSHEGTVTVLSVGRESEVIAENQLDGQIMASPAVVDNSLIMRTADAIYRFK